MKIKYINNKNSTTNVCVCNNVPLIKCKAYEKLDFIRHGFSTRLGGYSDGIFSTMNLSFGRGDTDETVMRNFQAISNALGTAPENMVYAKQTHTTNVLAVDKSYLGMGITRERNFDNIDGLITNEQGICLVTAYADCVPLFFVDPVNKAIGLSHSGWRGTVGKIAVKTVKLMQEKYNSNPSDIIAFIGPSICKECYEISSDVAEKFIEKYTGKQSEKILFFKGNDKYMLDLHLANVYNIIEAGLKKTNIHITDICTNCNPNFLYSHRASKGQRGGLCGFLQLDNKE